MNEAAIRAIIEDWRKKETSCRNGAKFEDRMTALEMRTEANTFERCRKQLEALLPQTK